jgi:hypothetical protein
MLPRREHPALALIRLFALLGIMLGSALPALAQALAIEAIGGVLVTEMSGHKVTIPAPPWTQNAGPGEHQSPFVFNRLDAGVETLVFVPPGETIVSWTHMMGVVAVNKPGYKAAAHIASMVQPMAQSCATGQMSVTELPSAAPTGQKPILLVCGRYRPSGSGPRGCAAGMIVAAVRESRLGAMKVYDEWCISAFDAKDQATWPVKPEEILGIAAMLDAASRYEPLPATQ